MFAAARDVRDEFLVGEGVGIDRLELAVLRDGGWLVGLVPLAQLLTPELSGQHLLGALEALRDLRLRSGHYELVGHAVDVLHSQSTDHHPVEACKVGGAAGERRGVHFLPVAGHRPREVDGVELVEPGSRGFEAQLHGCDVTGHRRSSLGRVVQETAISCRVDDYAPSVGLAPTASGTTPPRASAPLPLPRGAAWPRPARVRRTARSREQRTGAASHGEPRKRPRAKADRYPGARSRAALRSSESPRSSVDRAVVS